MWTSFAWLDLPQQFYEETLTLSARKGEISEFKKNLLPKRGRRRSPTVVGFPRGSNLRLIAPQV